VLYQLIYASRARQPMSDSELTELLDVSRRNNTRDGVTGMLLYDAGAFIQVLEGEQEAVERLWLRIVKDRRHDGIVVIDRGPIDRRGFAQWPMGTIDLSPSVRALPGMGDLLRAGASALTGATGADGEALPPLRDGRWRRHVR
jgi:hypothetical protein